MKKKILRTLFLLFIFTSKFCQSQIINLFNSYNDTDVTKILQDAINSEPDEIIIPYISGKEWISGPLNIRSNITIRLEKGVVLRAKRGAFVDKIFGYQETGRISFLNIVSQKNVNIIGNGAQILMNIDEYRDINDGGEWRHAVNILDSENVLVEGLKIIKSGGDGIYIGKRSSRNILGYCNNIEIRNVYLEGNARTGLAIVTGKNIFVKGCNFIETAKYNGDGGLCKDKGRTRMGVAPCGTWSGIIIEPSVPNSFFENINIDNCTFENNDKGKSIHLFFRDDKIDENLNITINITNNYFKDYLTDFPQSDGSIFLGSLNDKEVSGFINLKNNYTENTEKLIYKHPLWTNTRVEILDDKSSHDSFKRLFVGNGSQKGGTSSEDFFTHPDSEIYTGDYNGDGKTDLFIRGYGSSRALYLANSYGNGFDEQFVAKNWIGNIYEDPYDGIGGTDSENFFTHKDSKIITGHFNNDKNTDLFVIGVQEENGNRHRAMYLAKKGGSGFSRKPVFKKDQEGGTDYENFFTHKDSKIFTGDFNGDGYTDLFVLGLLEDLEKEKKEKLERRKALYYSDGSGGFIRQYMGHKDGIGGTDVEVFDNENTEIITGFFNDDKVTDIFVKVRDDKIGLNRWALYIMKNGLLERKVLSPKTASEFSNENGGLSPNNFFTHPDSKIYTGDYNGDKKTDFFVKGYGTSRALYVVNKSGNGFELKFLAKNWEGKSNEDPYDGIGGTDSEEFFTHPDSKIYTGDYNGDGKTDFFVKGYGTSRILYLAHQNGFKRKFLARNNKNEEKPDPYDQIGGTDSEEFFTHPDSKIYTGDYNGDGKTDFFIKGFETYRALYIAKSNNRHETYKEVKVLKNFISNSNLYNSESELTLKNYLENYKNYNFTIFDIIGKKIKMNSNFKSLNNLKKNEIYIVVIKNKEGEFIDSIKIWQY